MTVAWGQGQKAAPPTNSRTGTTEIHHLVWNNSPAFLQSINCSWDSERQRFSLTLQCINTGVSSVPQRAAWGEVCEAGVWYKSALILGNLINLMPTTLHPLTCCSHHFEVTSRQPLTRKKIQLYPTKMEHIHKLKSFRHIKVSLIKVVSIQHVKS